jgi:hypothetical protein
MPFIVTSTTGVARRYTDEGRLLEADVRSAMVVKYPGEQVIDLRDEPGQVEEVRRLNALENERRGAR